MRMSITHIAVIGVVLVGIDSDVSLFRVERFRPKSGGVMGCDNWYEVFGFRNPLMIRDPTSVGALADVLGFLR